LPSGGEIPERGGAVLRGREHGTGQELRRAQLRLVSLERTLLCLEPAAGARHQEVQRRAARAEPVGLAEIDEAGDRPPFEQRHAAALAELFTQAGRGPAVRVEE